MSITAAGLISVACLATAAILIIFSLFISSFFVARHRTWGRNEERWQSAGGIVSNVHYSQLCFALAIMCVGRAFSIGMLAVQLDDDKTDPIVKFLSLQSLAGGEGENVSNGRRLIWIIAASASCFAAALFGTILAVEIKRAKKTVERETESVWEYNEEKKRRKLFRSSATGGALSSELVGGGVGGGEVDEKKEIPSLFEDDEDEEDIFFQRQQQALEKQLREQQQEGDQLQQKQQQFRPPSFSRIIVREISMFFSTKWRLFRKRWRRWLIYQLVSAKDNFIALLSWKRVIKFVGFALIAASWELRLLIDTDRIAVAQQKTTSLPSDNSTIHFTSNTFSSFPKWIEPVSSASCGLLLPFGSALCLYGISKLEEEGGWDMDRLRVISTGIQHYLIIIFASLWIKSCRAILETGWYFLVENNPVINTAFYSTIWMFSGMYGAKYDIETEIYRPYLLPYLLLAEIFFGEIVLCLWITRFSVKQAMEEATAIKRVIITHAERDLVLSLSNEHRTSIPRFVINAPLFAFLIKLDVSHNRIRSIPRRLVRMRCLEELNLSFNRIHKLPLEIGWLSKLKLLFLDANRLTSLPGTMRYLQDLLHLSFSRNFLLHFPEFLVHLKRLQTLDVSFNHLSHIPPDLQSMPLLRALNMSHNLIEDIPSQFFAFPMLEALDISFNRIFEVPQSLLRDSKIVEFIGEGNIISVQDMPGLQEYHKRAKSHVMEQVSANVVGIRKMKTSRVTAVIAKHV